MSRAIEPDTSKEAIGARLAAVRTARGLTTGGLATALGISPQRWNNYEQGLRVPPPEILSKLWQITGATADYILFGRMDGLPTDLYKRLNYGQDEAERSA